MAEYLPTYKPGQAVTLKASAAITGGQLVAISGSGTVAPAAAGATAWLGVAAFDAAANDNVTVYCGGVQNIAASANITAGAVVSAAAGGKVATAGATPAAAEVVGIALTTAATDARVRVAMAR